MRLALISITGLALAAVAFDAWYKDPATAGLCAGGMFIMAITIAAEWRNEYEKRNGN